MDDMTTTRSSYKGNTSIWWSGVILSGGLQRLSHYGIRSLLILFLIENLDLSAYQAGQVYGLFYGSFFLTAILGGIFGSLLGHGAVGSFGLVLMLAGHIGLFWVDQTITFVALIAYTIGFGLFDTNLSVAAARIYSEERMRDSAYTVLYTAINIGAAIGPFLFGFLAVSMGVRYSLLLGGIWPFLAYFLFWKSTRRNQSSVAISSKWGNKSGEDAKLSHSSCGEVPYARGRWVFVIVLGLAGIIFAGVFDQLGSSITLLAQNYLQRDIGITVLHAGYIQSINPIFVIVLGPIFATFMKRATLDRRCSQVDLLAIGIIFLGSGFGILSLSTIGIEANGQDNTVGWSWVFLAIFLVSVGELLFAPIALSLVSRLAAPHRQAFMVGLWTAVYGVGAYLSGTMAGAMGSSGQFSILLAVSAAACWLVALLLWGSSMRNNKASVLRSEV